MPRQGHLKRKEPSYRCERLTHIRKCAQCGKTFEIPLLVEKRRHPDFQRPDDTVAGEG